jgi:hypothetical protein
MAFCTDTDLLYWEPNLFKDAAAVGQTLLSGVASVSGTTATFSGLSLTDGHVRPLDVIYFSGTGLAGAFPIVSVDSDTTLTLSVLYDGLFPTDGSAGAASHVGTASSQAFAIRTFYPQRQTVTRLLLQAAGVDPAAVNAEAAVVDSEVMKRACALGTLQMIYSALAASSTSPTIFLARADLYQQLYRQAMRSARVEIDTDGDGSANVVRLLNEVSLVRG